jgi:hypothetical protein
MDNKRVEPSEVFKWLHEKKYQTDYGQQEYRMYYDVDMPKILNAFLEEYASSLREENEQLKRDVDDLNLRQKRIDDAIKVYKEESERLQSDNDRLREALKECHYVFVSLSGEAPTRISKIIQEALQSNT